MKTQLTAIFLLSTLTFANFAKADDAIMLPVISKPAILEEGTQRDLSASQIAELLPWAKDSKMFLVDLLENIQGLTTSDKIERLADGIAAVVGESATKNSELLMRYALNRGLVLNDILTKEINADAVGTQDAKLRVLKSSIEMAIKYYDIDMAILSKKTIAPYVIFGMDYFEFLSELNKSVFDASAQYIIQRTALEWLQWDLYRDLNNASYAPQIIKINNSLKTLPTKKITDAQAIANIRIMKKTAQQLNVKATLVKLVEDRILAAAKNEEERRLLIAKTEEEKRRIQQEMQMEKLRGNRSALDFEKIKTFAVGLNSSSWSTRQDAARALSGVIGGDVSIMLIERLFLESDSDVVRELVSALNVRLGNNLYLMKIESPETFNANIITAINKLGRPGSWGTRQNVASVLGKVASVESYKFLSTWLQIENDSDVKSTLLASMAQIEKVLK